MSATTNTGAPELPRNSLNFILPNGTKVQNIEILSLTLFPLSGTYNIYPAQPTVPMTAPPPAWVPPDSSIYSQNVLYPDSTPVFILHKGGFSGIPVVKIGIYPLLYNPVKDSLYLVQSVTFRFVLETVAPSQRPRIMGERIFQLYKEAIRSSVHNQWEVDVYYTPPPLIPDEELLSRGDYEVAIVTTSEMAPAYQPLAQWLVEKGMPTRIVTLDWIYSMYDGYWTYQDYAGWSAESIRDDAAKIKEFLYDAHWSHGLAFAILGGSDDTEFPFRYCWGLDDINQIPGTYNVYIPPADLYFQDFTGEWEIDDDGRIGEPPPPPDNPDYYEEIFIGRVPAWNYDQALSWVEKRLTYEKSPANRELMTHSLWICQENFDYPFRTYMEETKQRFPNYITQHQLVDFLCDPVHHELIDTLSIGYGIVSHYGHGAPDGLRTNSLAYGNPYKELLLSWEYGNFPSLDEVYNVNKYFIFYSFGCITAAFDSLAESVWNGNWNGDIYPCISEGFVSFYRLHVPPDRRPAIGAVAYIGNTRPIFADPSLRMHRSFLRNLFATPKGYIIGISHASSKYSENFVDWNWAYMNNLFGSPEMPVWTQNPKDMIVEHPDAIPANAQINFEVTVVYEDPSGAQPIPLQNALVTLYKSVDNYPQVYQTELTNADGKAYFNLNVPTPGGMKVTVTKHNFIPYQGDVQVFEFDVHIPVSHTAYSEGRKLVRQPNTENLHLSYTYVDVEGGVNGPDDWSAYSLSTDGGVSWGQGQNVSRFTQNPSIALTTETNLRPCLAFRNSLEPYQLDQPAVVYFARYDEPDWVVYTVDSYPCIPGVFYPKVQPPAIRIDANNICHMVYAGILFPGKMYVVYKRFDVFNPLTETVIIDSAIVLDDWELSSPSIALQYGYPHIVYDFPQEQGVPTAEIWYKCLTESGWTDPINISNSFNRSSLHPFIYLTNEKAIVVWSEEEVPGNYQSTEIYWAERYLNQSPDTWTKWKVIETPNQASDWPVITAQGKILTWSEHQFTDGKQNWEVLYHSDIYGDGNLSNSPYTQSLYPSCDWRQTPDAIYLYTAFTENYLSETNPYIFGVKTVKKGLEYIPIPLYTIYAGSEYPSPYLIQRDGYIPYEDYPVDFDSTELVYKFTGLKTNMKYRLAITAYHESDGEWREWVKIDNTAQHLIKYASGIPKTVELSVPPASYMDDGEIIIRIPKISGDFAMCHKGNLYEFEKEQAGGLQTVMSIPQDLTFGLTVFPNIVGRNTQLQFTIPVKQKIRLNLYDIVGRKVATIVDKSVESGIYCYDFDTSNLSAGIYFLILKGEKETKTAKVLIVK
ncbi:MAG: C25 family cysteine peptidase [bacterium]